MAKAAQCSSNVGIEAWSWQGLNWSPRLKRHDKLASLDDNLPCIHCAPFLVISLQASGSTVTPRVVLVKRVSRIVTAMFSYFYRFTRANRRLNPF